MKHVVYLAYCLSCFGVVWNAFCAFGEKKQSGLGRFVVDIYRVFRSVHCGIRDTDRWIYVHVHYYWRSFHTRIHVGSILVFPV